MSTILPLEVVYGRSTWSLTTEAHQVERLFDPSPLFGIKVYSRGSDPHGDRVTIIPPDRRALNVYEAPDIEQLPHREGPLGDGWFEHDAFLKSINTGWANYQNNIYENHYFLDTYSPDGEFGIDYWGPELVAGYRFIKPFVGDNDGEGSSGPFELSDITAPQEEVFLTGECGDGGGSERPESGLLYPRKV